MTIYKGWNMGRWQQVEHEIISVLSCCFHVMLHVTFCSSLSKLVYYSYGNFMGRILSCFIVHDDTQKKPLVP